MLKKISVGKEVAINIFNTRYRAQTIFRHYRIRVKNMDPRTRLSRFVSWIGYLLRAELMVENLPANAGDARDTGSVPGLRKSPGVGNGNPSDILTGRIPWTEEPGGLQSMGLQ